MPKSSSKGVGGKAAGDGAPRRPRQRMKLAAAVKSGLRRYPRELLEVMRTKGPVPDSARFVRAWEGAVEEPKVSVLAWLGHCTVLLRVGRMTVLTDPVLSHRIGPRVGSLTVGLKRLQPSPVAPEELPHIDLIAVSHPHFDHLDKPTLRELVSDRTVVVTARRTRRLIPRGFRHVVELDWDQTKVIGEMEVSAIQPAHWGARTAWDRHRGYNSYLMTADGSRLLFAGDTAQTEAFSGVGAVDLAIFGIGAYEPWVHAHATPEQVWSMFTQMGGRTLLPVHHSTFRLSEEPHGEPMQRLIAAAGKLDDRVIRTLPGEVVKVKVA